MNETCVSQHVLYQLQNADVIFLGSLFNILGPIALKLRLPYTD